MASEEFDWQELNNSDLLEGVVSVLMAPVVLPIAAGMNQPMAKRTIKDAIAFSQRCKEAVSEAGERFEDLLAEAQVEIEEEAQIEPTEAPLRSEFKDRVPSKPSALAGEISDWVTDVNAQVAWLSNGYVDLRLLMPLGFSALALRQLCEKGLELDQIPWYNLAWYAFDSFKKLNVDDRPVYSSEAPLSSPPETDIPHLITEPEQAETEASQESE
jgi:hypothetical protein